MKTSGEKKQELVLEFLKRTLGTDSELSFFMSRISKSARMTKAKAHLFSKYSKPLIEGVIGMSGQVYIAKCLSH